MDSHTSPMFATCLFARLVSSAVCIIVDDERIIMSRENSGYSFGKTDACTRWQIFSILYKLRGAWWFFLELLQARQIEPREIYVVVDFNDTAECTYVYVHKYALIIENSFDAGSRQILRIFAQQKCVSRETTDYFNNY